MFNLRFLFIIIVKIFNVLIFFEMRYEVLDLIKSDFFDEIEVEVEVLNLNDNFPVFPVLPPVQVLENRPVGFKLAQIAATDGDSGEYGEVTYSTMSSIVRIDENSGEIFLAKNLDREAEGDFLVSIIATDGAGLQVAGNRFEKEKILKYYIICLIQFTW